MTPTTKNAIFGVFLVIIVIIASVAGVVLRTGSYVRNLDRPPKEHFDEEHMSVKNDIYQGFIQPYFSSGYDEGDESVRINFTPTVADVACVTMEDGIRDFLDCDGAKIDTVSVRDDRIVNMPGQETCNSMLASKQPSNATDADIRILTGMYRLTKACIDITFSDINGNDGEVTLRVKATNPSAVFIVLNRPVFLATDASYLYRFDYEDSDETTYRVYRGLNAESHRESDDADSVVEFKLKRVDDDKILSRSNAKKLESMYDEDTDEDKVLHATLFYLRYSGPMEIGTVRLRFDEQEAVTLVFPLTSSKLDDESNWFDSNNYSSPRLRIKGRGRNSGDAGGSVRVKIGEGSDTENTDIIVRNRGYLVVTYVMNVMILCYMSRDRITFVRKNNVDKLTVDDPTLFQVTVDGAGARVPAICHPANTFSIANLYDMYVRLVSFS